jgi:hypothetical protein
MHTAFEEHFAFVDVADARGNALIHDDVADFTHEVARLPRALHRVIYVGRFREQVWPETRQAWMMLDVTGLDQLSPIRAFTNIGGLPDFDSNSRVALCFLRRMQPPPPAVHA